jgi:hypothetical protein
MSRVDQVADRFTVNHPSHWISNPLMVLPISSITWKRVCLKNEPLLTVLSPDPPEVRNARIHTVALVASMSALAMGYDTAVIGGTMALDSFRRDFALDQVDSTVRDTIQGNIVSTFQVSFNHRDEDTQSRKLTLAGRMFLRCTFHLSVRGKVWSQAHHHYLCTRL